MIQAVCFDRARRFAPVAAVLAGLLITSCSERTRSGAKPYSEKTITQLQGLASYMDANGDRATATAVYRGIVDDDRATATVLIDVAKRLEAISSPELAVVAYDRAQQLEPSNTEALKHLGRVLMRLGRLDQSIDALERWVDLEDDEPEPYRHLAAVLDFAGRHQEAKDVYKRALEEMGEDNADLSINYALSLALGGEFNLAIERAVQTLNEIEGDRRHLQNTVLIYALAGRIKEAQERGKPLGEFETNLILRQARQLNELETSAARARSLGGMSATL